MDTTELGRAARETAEREFNAAAEQAKELSQEWGGKVKSAARNSAATADQYVHEYAWTSLAVMAVAAVMVGYLLGGRRG